MGQPFVFLDDPPLYSEVIAVFETLLEYVNPHSDTRFLTIHNSHELDGDVSQAAEIVGTGPRPMSLATSGVFAHRTTSSQRLGGKVRYRLCLLS